MTTTKYAARRLAQACPVVFGVIVLNFVLIHMAPGDPALMLAGEAGATTEEILSSTRAEFGLDKSLPRQLLIYVAKLIRGDLGFSYTYRQPVAELIVERIPATVLLIATGLILAMWLGIAGGVAGARYSSSLLDSVINAFGLFGYSMPVFWSGIMLLLAFSVYAPWFPSHGMRTIELIGAGAWATRAVDVGHHLVLPAVTLGIVYAGLYSRLVRASMLDVLNADFVRTARAKGLGEGTVMLKHTLRNALVPVITIGGLQIGQLLAGTVLVETVFGWPGMGRLLLDSVLRRDYPLLMGILFCSSLMVIVTNLVTDLSYAVVDPRIRYG